MELQTKQTFYVDMNDVNNNIPIVIRQYDKNTRVISIILTDNNSVYNIPLNTIIKIHATQSNGNTLTEDCTLSNNIITYLVSEDFTNISGITMCEIGLYNFDPNGDTSKDVIIHSSTFEVNVDKSTVN